MSINLINNRNLIQSGGITSVSTSDRFLSSPTVTMLSSTLQIKASVDYASVAYVEMLRLG